jgi:hypothetical protein
MFACSRGNSFAMVRNGAPDDAGAYGVLESGGLTVYVPVSMSFEGDTPRIVTFRRNTGSRDVGVPNVIR